METRDFVMGYGAGKGAAIQKSILDETDAWLEENIDPSTGYVLDNTLSLDNAAPPAKAVGDLKSAFDLLGVDNIEGTTQTVAFDSAGRPSTITHTKNNIAVRTDSFTWGDGTVTEQRTLADGTYITIVTNLTTLVTTVSEIQEGT